MLCIAAALVLLAGLGLRDPWPADEPRFAAIARDMLASGDWIVPRIGGDVYADKPPLFFWLLAASLHLTGSVRAGFLLPTVVAGFVTLWAVYDLGRRLYSRRIAFQAGLLTLAIVQFPLEFKAAQIDPLLTMFTTLGLYGLVRHLLLGPSWNSYALAGLACGLGTITKGVGLLPLLLLVPYAALRRRGWPAPAIGWSWRWSLAPLAFLLAVSIWLLPLAVAVSGDATGELRPYVREIFLGQTVGRYLDAPGHLKPWWYFVVAVVPWAWWPVSLALPWLAGCWRAALRERDMRVALMLAWIGIVLAFFSLSSGKRGVYVLPAVPALAIATAPWTDALLRTRPLQRLGWASLAAASIALCGGAVYLSLDPSVVGQRLYGFTGAPHVLLVPFAVWALACVAATRPERGLVGLTVFLLGTWVLLAMYAWPRADVFRSGRIIMDHAYATLPRDAELGIAAPKESLILHARGPLTNFGHRRLDREQERFDAARWLAEKDRRFLVLRAEADDRCFDRSQATPLGHAHGIDWILVPHSAARQWCAGQGDAASVIAYRAPRAKGNPRRIAAMASRREGHAKGHRSEAP